MLGSVIPLVLFLQKVVVSFLSRVEPYLELNLSVINLFSHLLRSYVS